MGQGLALFFDKIQLLVKLADRNDHPAAVGQLLDKRPGDKRRGAGDDYAIKRRLFRPADIAIAALYYNIVITRLSSRAVARSASGSTISIV